MSDVDNLTTLTGDLSPTKRPSRPRFLTRHGSILVFLACIVLHAALIAVHVALVCVRDGTRFVAETKPAYLTVTSLPVAVFKASTLNPKRTELYQNSSL